MRKNIRLYFVILVVFIITSCSKSKIDPDNPILGLWTLDKVDYLANDTVYSFRRADRFENQKPGYQFLVNGTMISYQVVGRCASPLSYGESKGDWKIKKSTLDMRVNYWDGMKDDRFEVMSLSTETLLIKKQN